MPTLVLAAIFASALDPARAWSDRAAWQAAPEAELAGVDGKKAAPAEVRARWNKEWIFFEFVCCDDALVSPGSKDGEDHFKIGDVVEIFVGSADRPEYLEVHATPAGRKSVYAFLDYRDPAKPPAGCSVQAGRIPGGWRAVISVPCKILVGGEPWVVLAGRYDYDGGGARPVLSSFPAQRGKPDFHDRARFARLELRP